MIRTCVLSFARSALDCEKRASLLGDSTQDLEPPAWVPEGALGVTHTVAYGTVANFSLLPCESTTLNTASCGYAAASLTWLVARAEGSCGTSHWWEWSACRETRMRVRAA